MSLWSLLLHVPYTILVLNFGVSCSAGRNIFRALFKRETPARNELFLPKRMAYVVDLEDEYTDTDIPTTVIRSKADCPNVEVGSRGHLGNCLLQSVTYITNGSTGDPLKILCQERTL